MTPKPLRAIESEELEAIMVGDADGHAARRFYEALKYAAGHNGEIADAVRDFVRAEKNRPDKTY